MERYLKLKIVVYVIGFIFFPMICSGVEYRWGIEIEEYVTQKSNFGLQVPPPDSLILDSPNINSSNYILFTRDVAYNVLSFSPGIDVSFNKQLHCRFSGQLDWFRTLKSDDGETNDTDISVINAYLGYSGHKMTVLAGLQPLDFGSSYILDNYEPGIYAKFMKHDYFFTLKAAKVMDASKMISGSIGYVPDFFEMVEGFGVYFEDGDNSGAELINQFVLSKEHTEDLNLLHDLLNLTTDPVTSLQISSSKADIFWLGLNADLFLGDLYLSTTGISQHGSITFGRNGNTKKLDLKGFLVDIGASYNVNDWLSVEGFLFVASGDNNPLKGHFSGYVSPMPYNKRAMIFFDPEFFDLKSNDALTLGGMLWPGVIAPGIHVSAERDNGLSFDFSLISFFSEETFDGEYKQYGSEADIRIIYSFMQRYSVYLEASAFRHEDYFNEVYQSRFTDGNMTLPLDTASKLYLGFTLFFN